MGFYQPKKGKCRGCGKIKWLVVKDGYCKFCNEFHRKGKTWEDFKTLSPGKRLNSRSKKNKQDKREEIEVWKEIWEERPHQSEIDGTPLPEPMRSYYFSHILPKGSYGGLRKRKDNIMLNTLEQHMLWESNKDKIKDDPKWQWVFERAEKLKQEYGQ